MFGLPPCGASFNYTFKINSIIHICGNSEKRTRVFMKSELSKAPIPVGALSKAWVCSRSLTGIAVSNPAKGMVVCFLRVLCVLSGRGLCDWPNPRPEESYWERESVCVCSGYPLHSPVSPSLPLPASPCAITFQLQSTVLSANKHFSQQARNCNKMLRECSFPERSSVLRNVDW